MKKSVICVLGLMLAVSVAAPAQDLDEVLSNYYEAMGGLDKLKSVDTIKMSGRASFTIVMIASFSSHPGVLSKYPWCAATTRSAGKRPRSLSAAARATPRLPPRKNSL
ncbi:MAG: hypothetical protein R3244_10355 [Thermoanaerobaculia bacterium]|nr:hypothetical protein [Thermoanaerobaculia bacterium]